MSQSSLFDFEPDEAQDIIERIQQRARDAIEPHPKAEGERDV